MKKFNFIICGLGGQGILYITKIMSLAAIKLDYEVIASETHGMAQRGGSVISHLRVGTSICSSIGSGSADFIISLEENETFRNLHFLRKNGSLYTNKNNNIKDTKEIKEYIKNNNINYNSINASKIIKQFSAPLSLNVAMLGYFSLFESKPFSKESIRLTIEKNSPEQFKKINLTIFDICSKK